MGADRIDTSPSVEARQLPGKIFGLSGGSLASWRTVPVCAQLWSARRLGLAVGVVRAVDRVALGGAGMPEFCCWLRSRACIASFREAPRVVCVICPIVSSCRILCRAMMHGAVRL